jgi:hypothetical protein
MAVNKMTLPRVTLFAFVTAAATAAHAEMVDTRMGALEVVNGFPTPEAAQKLFDKSDFQRATQAYLWALPAVGFHGLHLAHLNTFGAKDGEVVLYVTLEDKAGMLTPNLTTIYAMSFWNLEEQGPLVIVVPPGASAGGVLDVWQRPITDVGQTGRQRPGRQVSDPPARRTGRQIRRVRRAAPADQSGLVRHARAGRRSGGRRAGGAQVPALGV